MLSVMGAVAGFSRSLIRQRQRERIALAKPRGANRGRKKTHAGVAVNFAHGAFFTTEAQGTSAPLLLRD